MAAQVSSLIRILTDEDNRTAVSNVQKSTVPVTRDLLGQSSNLTDDSHELDLGLQVPSGWEKRLDLKSAKVYIERSKTPDSPLNSDSKQHKMKINETEPKFKDLDFPPSPSKRTLNLFNETSSSLTNYASVCTLDKVKYALERADKELIQKRSSSSSAAEIRNSATPMAVGCHGCLSYVMVMKKNPRCPRDSVVPLSTVTKPRIDLNMCI